MIDVTRVLKFAIVGGFGALVNTSLLYALTEYLGLEE